MRYRCLRDCFVAVRFWRKGEEYDLPDDMEKNEKNFKLLGGSKDEAPATEPKVPKEKPLVIPTGFYWCTKCDTLHRLSEKSAIGKKHLKFADKAD